MNSHCNCNDILELSLFKEYGEVIAGKNNLDRPVRWVYLLETLPAFSAISQWLKGNELLFVTGLYIQDNEYKLLRLIDDSIASQIAGLVIFTNGPYITSISPKVIQKANQVGLPIITLPWHIKYLDAQEIICHFISKRVAFSTNVSSYLETILFNPIKDEKRLTKQALLYGIDFSKTFNVLALSLLADYPTNDSIMIKHIKECINDFFQIHNLNAHLLYHQDYFLIVFEVTSATSINEFLNYLKENLECDYPRLSYITGIGTATNNLSGLQGCLAEAKHVVKLKERTGTLLEHIYSYKELGFYRLFSLPENENIFHSIYIDTIDPLVQSDKHKHTEFIETLKTFFDCNLNIVKTADTLFIHRNTMRYRIKKIQELTGFDLGNFEHCHLLQTALIAYRVLHKDSKN